MFETGIVDREKLLAALAAKTPESFSFPELACLQAEDWLNGLSSSSSALFL
jgi:hypothetical protein